MRRRAGKFGIAVLLLVVGAQIFLGCTGNIVHGQITPEHFQFKTINKVG